MIRNIEPAGTLLFGRNMIARLSYEMNLLNIKNPVLITSPDTLRKGRKIVRKLNPGRIQTILITSGDPPEESDFLILAGGRELSNIYAHDKRPKALIPLNNSQLRGLEDAKVEITIIDSSFISHPLLIQDFLRNFAFLHSDGLSEFPGKLSVPPSFTFSCRTSVFIGEKALETLPDLLRKENVQYPLVLSDSGIKSAGLLETLEEVMNRSGLDFETFTDIPADSNIQVVNSISRLYRDKKNDGLIAFGGGSVIDTGKGVYLNVSLNTEDLAKWEGSNCIPRLNTPFLAIPTTSGTGSEVTKAAVITDEKQQRKSLFISPNLQPDYGILEGRLTATLPPFQTSITGMDALSHAIEAFTCLGKNPLSDQLAWTAIGLIRDNLIPSIKEPLNLKHREEMARASNLAGQAFSNSMVGMVHTIGHSVGAVCHVPHGSCMSILLPASLEFNFNKIKDYLAQLLPALIGPEEAIKIPENEKARKFIEAIRELNRTLKKLTEGRHPEKFSDVKDKDGTMLVKREDFDKIARTALGDASIIYNPEELRLEDILGILDKCF